MTSQSTASAFELSDFSTTGRLGNGDSPRGRLREVVVGTFAAAVSITGYAAIAHPLEPATLSPTTRAQGQFLNRQDNALPSLSARAMRAEEIRRHLRSFASVQRNWDGHDGVPPSDQAIQDAEAFLASLPGDANLPRVGLSGDGEIGFFWDYGQGQGFIDIGFMGNSAYSFYARDDAGGELFGDDEALDAEPRADLIDVIRNYV